MKKIVTLLTVIMISLLSMLCVYAQEGKVTYDGNANEFIFAPGSEFSPSDLFSNFKDVMPGDCLTQQITVKNDASKNVKVKIYLRSLGAHEDSVEFLSRLELKVLKSDENEMGYMFEAVADETDGLTDWVCLGTLYSGGEVNLDVVLNVPVELDNEYQEKQGYLDWEFMVEELPTEPDDPKPPKTGDDSHMYLWCMLALASSFILIVFVIVRKKENY